MRSENDKLERVESLLRRQGSAQLSEDFTQRVLHEVRRLPAPELLSVPARERGALGALLALSTGEKAAISLALLGALLVMLPGASDTLSALELQLADTTVTFSLGEAALSASLLSVAGCAVATAFLGLIGALSAKQKLLGA